MRIIDFKLDMREIAVKKFIARTQSCDQGITGWEAVMKNVF